MKITFKDGKVVEIAKSVTISNVKVDDKHVPMVNIVFAEDAVFDDISTIFAQADLSEITVEAETGITRVLTGYTKFNMNENIDDVNYSFVVSLEKEVTQ